MNREQAEAYLRLLAEEELRRAATRRSDGPSESAPEDDAVRPAGVTGTPAGGVAMPDGLMASGRGWSGDRALAEFYTMHYQALVAFAAVLVRDVQVAGEMVQDSLVAMYGGGQRLGDPGTALARARQAVVNRSRAVLRQRAGPGSGPRQVLPRERVARVAGVAQVLIAVGALDDEVADQILGDLELALATRQGGSPGWRRPGPGWWRRSPPVRPRPRPAAGSGTGAGPGAAPARTVRLGLADH
jgi:hypothetical protein